TPGARPASVRTAGAGTRCGPWRAGPGADRGVPGPGAAGRGPMRSPGTVVAPAALRARGAHRRARAPASRESAITRCHRPVIGNVLSHGPALEARRRLRRSTPAGRLLGRGPWL